MYPLCGISHIVRSEQVNNNYIYYLASILCNIYVVIDYFFSTSTTVK